MRTEGDDFCSEGIDCEARSAEAQTWSPSTQHLIALCSRHPARRRNHVYYDHVQCHTTCRLHWWYAMHEVITLFLVLFAVVIQAMLGAQSVADPQVSTQRWTTIEVTLLRQTLQRKACVCRVSDVGFFFSGLRF